MSYSFVTAYFKGEEARLISTSDLAVLSKVANAAEALEIIRLTDLGSYLAGMPLQSFNELDERLWAYLEDSIERVKLYELVPNDARQLLTTYESKYDAANIKATLRRFANGENVSLIPLGRIHHSGLLGQMYQASDIDVVRHLLAQVNLGKYAEIVAAYKDDMPVRSRLLLETRLDNQFYSDYLGVARKLSDGEELARAIGVTIDIVNLKMALRAVARGQVSGAADFALEGGYSTSRAKMENILNSNFREIPSRVDYLYTDMVRNVVESYERTGNITVIEGIVDRHGFMLLREILALKLFSPAVVLWYLVLKEQEIRNLRLIMKVIFDGHAVDTVKNSLVALA